MKNKEQVDVINKAISEVSESKCISFLWWLKKNPQAFYDFVSEEVCAMDVFIKYGAGKKYKMGTK